MQILMRMRALNHSMIFAVLSSLWLCACATTPVTKRTSLNVVPAAQLQSLGEQSFEQMKSEGKILSRGPVHDAVVAIGRQIAEASGVDYDWEFVVFDEPETVNAFCLPGGKVGVYTGILPIAKTTAGLATILGHEVAHATANHAGERMSQAFLVQAGLQVADLSLQDSRYRSLIMASLGIGAQIGVLLPYSRLHEEEADRIGLTYMARAGYDPNEAIGLWQRMAEAGGSRGPSFLSTHPDPAARAKKIATWQSKVLPLYQSSVKHATKPLPGVAGK